MRANNNFSVVVVNPASSVDSLAALRKQSSNRKGEVAGAEERGRNGRGCSRFLFLFFGVETETDWAQQHLADAANFFFLLFISRFPAPWLSSIGEGREATTTTEWRLGGSSRREKRPPPLQFCVIYNVSKPGRGKLFGWSATIGGKAGADGWSDLVTHFIRENKMSWDNVENMIWRQFKMNKICVFDAPQCSIFGNCS